MEAGADAVLVHSAASDSQEIDQFMSEWRDVSPVEIVPTTYSSTPIEHFRSLRIGLVIWANHPHRAADAAKRRMIHEILKHGTPARVESEITSMAEMFNLTGMAQVKLDEIRYSSAPELLSSCEGSEREVRNPEHKSQNSNLSLVNAAKGVEENAH